MTIAHSQLQLKPQVVLLILWHPPVISPLSYSFISLLLKSQHVLQYILISSSLLQTSSLSAHPKCWHHYQLHCSDHSSLLPKLFIRVSSLHIQFMFLLMLYIFILNCSLADPLHTAPFSPHLLFPVALGICLPLLTLQSTSILLFVSTFDNLLVWQSL